MRNISRVTSGGILPILVAMLLFGSPVIVASAATPTPTPTTGPQNNPANSFYVDPNAQLPWPVPSTPILPTAVTPQPTVYAATVPHATGYAGQVSTATAQIGELTGPVNGIVTPIAAMVTSGPQAGADDISVTGTDGDPVFVGAFLSDVGDLLGDAFAAIRAIPGDLAAISATFIVVVVLVAVMLVSPALRSGMELLSQLIKVILGVVRAVREIINTLALLFK